MRELIMVCCALVISSYLRAGMNKQKFTGNGFLFSLAKKVRKSYFMLNTEMDKRSFSYPLAKGIFFN
jgi:hypothetical protein